MKASMDTIEREAWLAEERRQTLARMEAEFFDYVDSFDPAESAAPLFWLEVTTAFRDWQDWSGTGGDEEFCRRLQASYRGLTGDC